MKALLLGLLGLNVARAGLILTDIRDVEGKSKPLFETRACVNYDAHNTASQNVANLTHQRFGTVASVWNASESAVRRYCDGEMIPGAPIEGTWLRYAVWDSLCNDGYRFTYFGNLIEEAVKFAKAQGCVGLVFIGTGSSAIYKEGVWLPANFDWGLEKDFPILHCGQSLRESDRVEPGASSSSEQWHWELGYNTYTYRGVPFDQIRVSISVQNNEWDEAVFSTPFYIFFFSIVAPVACVYLSVLSLIFLRQYLRKRKAAKVKRSIGTTELVLGIEFSAQGILALYFATCGMWARYGPAWFHFLCTTLLPGSGMATTLLTTIFWMDIKAMSKQLRTIGSGKRAKTAVERHQRKIAAMVFLCVGIDVFSAICSSFFVPFFEFIVSGALTLMQLAVSIYFIREVRASVNFFSEHLSNSYQKEGEKRSHMLKMKRTAKWLFLSACFMMLYVVVAFLQVFTYDGWTVGWMFIGISRYGASFTQVMAVTPGKDRKKKKKVTPHSTAGASAVNSQALSTTEGTTKRGSSTKKTNSTSGALHTSTGRSSLETSSHATSLNGSSVMSRSDSLASEAASIHSVAATSSHS